MSGYEVCRILKADPLTAAIPVLQISASFADPALRAAGLSGGADAYVAQPVHPAELLALVNALIRSHDSEKTLRFQAEISRRLALSLDYEETLTAIERVFVPRFADHCYAMLTAEPNTQTRAYRSSGFPEEFCPAALDTARTGHTHQIEDRALIVPLQLGRKRLGALVFTLDGLERRYRGNNGTLAEDLADRAALALQNATLYTAQRAAQRALIESEKLAAAGRLSAAIAHEINNPLESITNLLYIIDTSEETPPTIKGYVQEALSELSRLTHIARQSLGFYRELTGPATFDLNESVENTLEIYLKRFDGKHITVRRNYYPQPLELNAVKGEVRQVISNLLVNAYDALGEGGTLSVQTKLVDGFTIFCVSDNGTGIKPEVLARIFEPFFTTKDGTGTGLGLWVSDTIVRKHGGTIHVTSSTEGESRGTIFEVSLPVVPVS
jgi:signal transduction histidine kinase